MLKANISKAKNELSRYLDAVRGGETVIILDRNRPIAQIQPLTNKQFRNSARLDELAARGLIARPDATDQSWTDELRAPGGDQGTIIGSVEALLEERASGR